MQDRNETSLRECRFLNEGEFDQLFQTFTEAFSDYVVPFALTELQFRNHLNLTAVDLTRTLGCYEGDRLIGFSLNGFGQWMGVSTVYDAGTGVLPAFRRQGVSESMFRYMLPIFHDRGIQQCLLEVVTTNEGAVKLYEGLGFETTRELLLLQYDRKFSLPDSVENNVDIRRVDMPDWPLFTSFWDGQPSWQNSTVSIDRSLHMKTILGAFVGDLCVGYIVFSSRFGRISQIAVAREHRNNGIGTALIRAMHAVVSEGFSAQVINIDSSIDSANGLFRKLGYYERLRQHEMKLSF